MNILHTYYYFTSILSSKFCDELIEYGLSKQDTSAITRDNPNDESELKDVSNIVKKNNDLKQKRNSNIVWLDDNWIYQKIQPIVQQANVEAGWNFDWDWSEKCQFTKYNENQFYDWHCDSFKTPYNQPDNISFHNKIRKLSVTCNLSDPKDYEGGELEFDFSNISDKNNIKKCTEILPRGSVVVFPSFVWHRVAPVTKGTRYSLVMWNLGYPFK